MQLLQLFAVKKEKLHIMQKAAVFPEPLLWYPPEGKWGLTPLFALENGGCPYCLLKTADPKEGFRDLEGLMNGRGDTYRRSQREGIALDGSVLPRMMNGWPGTYPRTDRLPRPRHRPSPMVDDQVPCHLQVHGHGAGRPNLPWGLQPGSRRDRRPLRLVPGRQ